MTLNFKMSELIQSDTAIRHNINNMPDINSLDCMLDLIYYVLQPLRTKLGKPIIITSGYRNSEVNKLVKGKPNSQHVRGQAADIVVNGYTPKQLCEFIKNSGIEYDQLLNEYNQWTHISFVKGKNRKQFLTIT